MWSSWEKRRRAVDRVRRRKGEKAELAAEQKIKWIDLQLDSKEMSMSLTMP